MALRSETVISVVPGWFWMPMTTISPSRTCSRETMPSMGTVISVLLERRRARGRPARAPAAMRWGAAVAALGALERGARRVDLRRRGVGGRLRRVEVRPAARDPAACSSRMRVSVSVGFA